MGKLTNLNPIAPIADSDIPASVARDSEVTAAMNAHISATDPHTQYPTQADADARYFRGRSDIYTLDPPNLESGVLYKTFFTFVGAKVGDLCLVTPIDVDLYLFALWPFHVQGMVEQADTIMVYLWNGFTGPLDLGSFQIRVIVINF